MMDSFRKEGDEEDKEGLEEAVKPRLEEQKSHDVSSEESGQSTIPSQTCCSLPLILSSLEQPGFDRHLLFSRGSRGSRREFLFRSTSSSK